MKLIDMPNKAKNKEEFLFHWLRGTTCYNQQRSIFWSSGHFILLKHHGHSAYVDRVTKSVRCETYYCLYDLRKPLPDISGNPTLAKWQGRWTKQKQKELEAIVGLK